MAWRKARGSSEEFLVARIRRRMLDLGATVVRQVKGMVLPDKSMARLTAVL